MERHSTGYKFRFTNLVVMYEEELSDYEVSSDRFRCKVEWVIGEGRGQILISNLRNTYMMCIKN